MRQLTGVDASFLYMENSRTVGHVAGVIIVDPSTAPRPITAETLREFIGSRIHLLDPLRWRLVDVPLGIDLPYWVDDPDLDLEYHVRGLALPSPGTPEQLSEQAARIVSRRLDRAHPLWETYVIEGLQDGRVAILSKMHHAAVDGKAGVQVLTTLLDPSPDAREIPPPPATPPERVPGEAEMLTRGWMGLLGRPEAALRLAASVAKETHAGMGKWLSQGDAGRGRRPATGGMRAPKISWNASVSARRNWAYGSLPLPAVKLVKSRFEATVNDVVMAVCAGALRRWLIEHDELPETPLIAMVPVSLRSADRASTAGNEVSGMIAELPTHLDDPLQRLQAVHDAMVSAKEMHNAVPAHLLQDFSQFTAPAAAELVARAAAELRWADHMQAPFNVCISNVPGPRETLYYAGAEMLANFPFSMISDGMGLNITLQSYRDSLDFGLVSTPELIPDLWTLIDHLKIELAALVERAEAEGIEVGDPPTGPPDAEMKERHPDPRDVEAAAPPAKRAAAKKPAAAKKAAASKPAAAKKAAASKKPAARRTGPRNVQPPATEG